MRFRGLRTQNSTRGSRRRWWRSASIRLTRAASRRAIAHPPGSSEKRHKIVLSLNNIAVSQRLQAPMAAAYVARTKYRNSVDSAQSFRRHRQCADASYRDNP